MTSLKEHFQKNNWICSIYSIRVSSFFVSLSKIRIANFGATDVNKHRRLEVLPICLCFLNWLFSEASLLNKSSCLAPALDVTKIHRYQKSQNRLLNVCCVPATSTSLPRVSFFFSFLFLLSVTQIESFLFVLRSPRWPRQEGLRIIASS